MGGVKDCSQNWRVHFDCMHTNVSWHINHEKSRDWISSRETESRPEGEGVELDSILDLCHKDSPPCAEPEPPQQHTFIQVNRENLRSLD